MGMRLTNRDVGRQQSGFRLQRMRAAELLMESIEKDARVLVYSTVECGDDVARVVSNASESITTFEQNKQYNESTAFSFNSVQVLKSFSHFLETWQAKDFSSSVYFSFYSTTNIAKENKITKWKTLGIEPLDEPLLELISSRIYRNKNNVVDLIRTLLLDFIANDSSYEKTLSSVLSSWKNDLWISFLDRITLTFGAQDDEELHCKLIERIRNSSLYKGKQHADREETILSRILDLFDRRQKLTVPSERFVYGADLALIFHEVAAGIFHEVAAGDARCEDQSYHLWANITPNDQRGLDEKVKAICPSIEHRKLGALKRRAAAGLMLTVQPSPEQKKWLSIRYRVYCKCHDIIDDFIQNNKQTYITIDELELMISHLASDSLQALSQYAASFNQPTVTEPIVREIILELLDSCFLAFNEERQVVNE